MQQSNQQNQGKNAGQDTQTEEKQNLQKTNKSVAGGDVDETTEAGRRGGDFGSSAQSQATGQNRQADQTGTQNRDKSGIGRQQQEDKDIDADVDSDNDTQPGRTAQMDKNSKSSK